MMAKVTVSEPAPGARPATISDPCVGSGRMLLASYCAAKGNAILYAEDKDAICVKMATLNFLLHGCRAEVVCHDSLQPDTFNFGYHVCPYKEIPFPHLKEITREESQIVGRFCSIKEEQPEQFKQELEQRAGIIKGEQLSMF